MIHFCSMHTSLLALQPIWLHFSFIAPSEILVQQIFSENFFVVSCPQKETLILMQGGYQSFMVRYIWGVIWSFSCTDHHLYINIICIRFILYIECFLFSLHNGMIAISALLRNPLASPPSETFRGLVSYSAGWEKELQGLKWAIARASWCGLIGKINRSRQQERPAGWSNILNGEPYHDIQAKDHDGSGCSVTRMDIWGVGT